MKLIQKVIAAISFSAVAGAAHAGVPVFDGLNFAQAVQQVLAWAQQYEQMTESIEQLRNQYTQLQNTFNSMTGNRGLGTILNGAVDQAARRYLPAGGDQLGQLASGVVAGYEPLQATIASLRSTMSAMPADTFASGTSAANVLTAKINSLATQKALGEAAFTSAAQRTADLENMISTIGVADDPKAVAEMQARLGAQQALVANENAKLQAMAYMQQAEEQVARQRAAEVIATWSRPILPIFTME